MAVSSTAGIRTVGQLADQEQGALQGEDGMEAVVADVQVALTQ